MITGFAYIHSIIESAILYKAQGAAQRDKIPPIPTEYYF